MYKKRLWTALFVLCTILAVLTVSAFAAEDAPELVDGYYEIYTADQLYWFAAQVNSGNTSINGKLMADIVVNENVLNADGTLNGDGSNFRVWTPIGNSSNNYVGTFDGNGKVISGLYFNDTKILYVGLFGHIINSQVQNVGVVDSYLSGDCYVGGIVGYTSDNSAITNCYNNGTISGDSYVGGVVGYNNNGTVGDCYNTGTVSGDSYVGGVVGYSEDYSTVSNCNNTGSINGSGDYVGGVVGESCRNSTVSNCYNICTVSGDSYVGGVVGGNGDGEEYSIVSNCYNIGTVSGSGSCVGGVVGINCDHISNCHNTGSVSGDTDVGGVVGNSSDNSTNSITNCYNTGTVSARYYVGGVVGVAYKNAAISNSYNIGTVSGDLYVSGVVAYSYYYSTISNCYNIGSIDGSGDYVGGVVGYADYYSAVSNSFNTGSVSGNGNYVGGVVGDSYKSTVSNSYHLEDCASVNNSYGTAKTAQQFASGEVAYLLQGDQTEQVWGQKIGTEDYPVLGGEEVYLKDGTYLNRSHTWADATCTTPKTCSVCGETEGEALGHSYGNGFCARCGVYESAVLNGDVYEISNAGQLYWFSEQVSSGNTSINGKLMADIVVNENVLNADGTLNGDGNNFRAWTPIGNGSKKYTGTFEGNGKTVSGLYFNDTATSCVGLFGYLENGAVQNVGVLNSYLSGDEDVGGVVGCNYLGTVSNSHNTGSVSGSGNNVGGVVGYSYGTITNCYNSGNVSGNESVGGVVGYKGEGGPLSDCNNSGNVSGSLRVGGVVGCNHYCTVSNSYNSGTVSGSGDDVGGVVGDNLYGTVSSSHNTGEVSGSSFVGGVVGINERHYIYGTVSGCYNTGSVSGSLRVGGVVGCNDYIVNNCYNTGTVNGSKYVGGVVGYNNDTASNCHNTGDTSGGSYVGGVVGYNDNYGTINNCYNTGAVSGSGTDVGGVVGRSCEGTVSGCHNTGNVSGSEGSVGGVAGSNEDTVINCYNTGSVSGIHDYVGGVVGYNDLWFSNGTVINCYNTGTVSGREYVGGIVGCSGEDGIVSNSYYLSGCFTYGNVYGTAMTASQFASGEVAYLLQGDQEEQVWGQLIGAEMYPVLNGEKVYMNDTVYTNTCEHEWIYSFDGTTYNLSCSVCGQVALAKESTDGKQFKFNTASPALAVDIVMNIAVTLPAGFENPYMVVEFNGTTATLNDYTINAENGRYEYAFPGINPQVMGDTFVATLYANVDGVQVTVELEYSMLKYINSQLKKATTSAELRTALSDLVMYGEANQIYEGYKTDALLSTLLDASATLTPSTFVNLDASYNQMAITGTADANIDLKGVSLSLGSRVLVRVTVFCADAQTHSVKATINGESFLYPVSELALADGYTGRYVLEFDQIRATQFGEEITFSFLDADGNQVGRTLTYTVYTYVQKNQNAANEKLVNLLKAIYNYGESVKKI